MDFKIAFSPTSFHQQIKVKIHYLKKQINKTLRNVGISRYLLVGRESTPGLLANFVSNVRHMLWAIPQTHSEGSFRRRPFFHFLLDKLEGILSDDRHDYNHDRSELRCYIQYAQTTHQRTDCLW